MRQYFRDVASVWEELRLTPREFRASGDLILVTGRVSARSRSRTVSGSTGWIWRVRDGKVVYVRVYASAADATAAFEDDAGLTPQGPDPVVVVAYGPRPRRSRGICRASGTRSTHTTAAYTASRRRSPRAPTRPGPANERPSASSSPFHVK